MYPFSNFSDEVRLEGEHGNCYRFATIAGVQLRAHARLANWINGKVLSQSRVTKRRRGKERKQWFFQLLIDCVIGPTKCFFVGKGTKVSPPPSSACALVAVRYFGNPTKVDSPCPLTPPPPCPRPPSPSPTPSLALVNARCMFLFGTATKIKSEAKAFVYNLLKFDPRRRWTVQGAIASPWLKRFAPGGVDASPRNSSKASHVSVSTAGLPSPSNSLRPAWVGTGGGWGRRRGLLQRRRKCCWGLPVRRGGASRWRRRE